MRHRESKSVASDKRRTIRSAVQKQGLASASNLRRMGETAKKGGIMSARKRRPQVVKLSAKSWARLEPLRNGIRVELHLHESDTPSVLAKQLGDLLEAARTPATE